MIAQVRDEDMWKTVSTKQAKRKNSTRAGRVDTGAKVFHGRTLISVGKCFTIAFPRGERNRIRSV
jgi:hypothetical protein